VTHLILFQMICLNVPRRSESKVLTFFNREWPHFSDQSINEMPNGSDSFLSAFRDRIGMWRFGDQFMKEVERSGGLAA
jgi:hypothetical protein